MKQIVLAGGSGYLGQLLAAHFGPANRNIIVLTRSPKARSDGVREVLWDGRTVGDWQRELEGAEAVINLTGRSVNCRYNRENRRQIVESRVCSTRVLGEAIGQCARPPHVWLNASTATIYKHSMDTPMDESGEIGGCAEAKDEFSVEVAQAWEQAFAEARTPSTRKVAMRMAMVFGPEPGTVFRVMRRLVRLGMGGAMAGGRQYASWIHHADFCRAVGWLLAQPDFSGSVNLTAPNPLPNREMMRTLRRVCGGPPALPVVRWMMEIGSFFLRTETELMIKSRRVVPGRLMGAGFEFCFPRFEDAVSEIESHVTGF